MPPIRTADIWLEQYAKHHQHPANKVLHWLCVPAVVVAIVGLLWSLPVPAAFGDISPALNWGTTFLLAAVVYYFIMSIPLALGMLPVVLAITAAVIWLEQLDIPLWLSSAALFVVAWLGQFVGHVIEGEHPAFLRDLQFLMIGPVWMLAALYRRLGIPY